ncbi:MED6 mediator sub complex component-domain-containing protein [Neohortaea acidophila]|uniref:Mediator of RNA polymerase II transcription subunit 6 n=1 Tax=Neohortaea acidophila TaxID=245834 RepID=A0A6A6PFT4_9PEZI|nr:MED6 mediator sub complex component-domain-containing protein [Neohortaea acidophila]KAF2478838.1 MED6 mediator sub complex component-domain-containing protein [Neohortaea acidophila]
MDENMIHRYLSVSPFFDDTSKNGLHFLQAEKNMAEFDLVKDRRRFEEDLARHVGSEYMIVGEPADVVTGPPGPQQQRSKSGVWNLRKQYRDRRRDVDTGRMTEELTTLGSYYIVGENMYQAPSVGDVVGNRLLSAATSLSKFFDQAAKLPSFSATAGYSYLPQSSTTAAGGASTQASPARSREGSVLPNADSQSLRSTSLGPVESHPAATGNNATSTLSDARLFAQSFRMALEFHDEYMDENALQGEPGNLSFTSSLAAVKKRKAADEEAAALAAKVQEQRDGGSKTSPAVKTETRPEPPAVMTEAKTASAGKDRRGSRPGDRARRKKSRANIGSVVGLPESSST